MTHVGRLIVVRDKARRPKFRCMVPDCGAVFYDGEERAYERHCIGCAERNHTKVVAQSVRHRAPDLFDELHPSYNGDLALQRWIARNRDAVIEGRKKL